MAKKNKDIEVQVQEVQKKIAGNMTTITQLVIGKKVIGEIIPAENQFDVWSDDEKIATVKSLEAGIEAVIRTWNLHE